ncbi:MAG TPA: ABC transporter permease [Chitinophagales bacterium]|nr:ABC transporter permease [Chitinophagales bacterium]
MMVFKLAWRNIWRNKRRTMITAASVFTAVILALVMRSAQLGSYEHMINNVVGFYTGHIQVHKKGYWDEKSIDNSFVPTDTIYNIINSGHDVSAVTPRFESFALASAQEQTKGTMVAGIEPAGEDKVTNLKGKLVQGSYLTDSSNGVLLAEGLAKELKLGIGDTLVLLGQGYHGATAAGLFPITGIVKFPTPDLNKGIVYMAIAKARDFYSADHRVTSIVVSVPAGKDALAVAGELRRAFKGMPVEVLDWKQMIPDLVQLIKVDNVGGIITIAILYMVISFGIFSTILMMLSERMHEFGVLMAVGMKKMLLIRIVTVEILMISALGIILGLALGLPIVGYFHLNPIHVTGESAKVYEQYGMEAIFPFSMKWTIFLWQTVVVEGITLLLAFYPYLRLSRLKTIDALKT